jgi:hypothetical protein
VPAQDFLGDAAEQDGVKSRPAVRRHRDQCTGVGIALALRGMRSYRWEKDPGGLDRHVFAWAFGRATIGARQRDRNDGASVGRTGLDYAGAQLTAEGLGYGSDEPCTVKYSRRWMGLQ